MVILKQMNLSELAACVFVVVVLSGCSHQTVIEMPAYTGRVTDYDDSRPAQEVEVIAYYKVHRGYSHWTCANMYSTTTDEDGYFHVPAANVDQLTGTRPAGPNIILYKKGYVTKRALSKSEIEGKGVDIQLIVEEDQRPMVAKIRQIGSDVSNYLSCAPTHSKDQALVAYRYLRRVYYDVVETAGKGELYEYSQDEGGYDIGRVIGNLRSDLSMLLYTIKPELYDVYLSKRGETPDIRVKLIRENP